MCTDVRASSEGARRPLQPGRAAMTAPHARRLASWKFTEAAFLIEPPMSSGILRVFLAGVGDLIAHHAHDGSLVSRLMD